MALRMPSRPISGRWLGGSIIELRQPDSAHQHGIGFGRKLLRFRRKRRARLVDRDAAQQAFANGQLMAPFLGHDAQYAHSFSGDLGADAVTGQHQYIQIQFD